ncbi:MAG: HAD-IC family P-type ATPase [Candidatus Thermoplasmatota archaeon]|nr:HAD-IC family P-type ATPase [Candidatus Thermoplasmatota archaeon]
MPSDIGLSTGTPSQDTDGNRLNVKRVVKDSILRMNPVKLASNPVMLVVEISFFLVSFMAIAPGTIPSVSSPSEQLFYVIVAFILGLTVWFSTLSDSIAEAEIRATATSLKSLEKEVEAKKMDDQRNIAMVSSKDLRTGDIIYMEKGDSVPIDCEVLEGIAMVDESLITGESSPVRKTVGDTLIGGSTISTDSIVARVTVNIGESYLSKLISIVESSKRPKTPNERAVSILLLGLTVIFTVIMASILSLALALGIRIDLSVLIALYVCLLPTTIGALLPSIGISGINRMSRSRIIAKSGRAIEAAGDTDTLMLDKTGTITFGNRVAVELVPLGDHTAREIGEAAFLSSWHDDTPEGRSIMSLAYKHGYIPKEFSSIDRAESTEFSAATRRSGLTLIDADDFRLPKGGKDMLQRTRMRRKYLNPESGEMLEISKGAPDAIKEAASECPSGFDEAVVSISSVGDTAMAISVGESIVGLIRLKDTLKPGIREKIEAVKAMGIRPVMITGDQPDTARTIASEVGIEDFVSQAKPETKLEVVKKEQSLGRITAMIGDGSNDAPALAAAEVGLSMASGTMAAKEAANLVDLESNPAKIIDVVVLGKQLLMTRGAITTFSIANDIAKYFAIVPVLFVALPDLGKINILGLGPHVAVISALIFNAIIIPAMIPLATRGASFKPMKAMSIFLRNIITYGAGGVLLPFAGIELIGLTIRFFVGGV